MFVRSLVRRQWGGDALILLDFNRSLWAVQRSDNVQGGEGTGQRSDDALGGVGGW